MPTETSAVSNLLFSLSTRPVDVDDDLFSRGRRAEPIRWTAPPPQPAPAPLPRERAPRATRAPDLGARPSHPALRSAKRDRIWPLFVALIIAAGGGIAGARYLNLLDDDATIDVPASAFLPPKVEVPPPAPVVEPIAAAPAAAPVATEEPKPAEAPAEAVAPVEPAPAKKSKKHAVHAKKHVAAAKAHKAKKAAPIAPVIKDDDDEPAAAPAPAPAPKPSRPLHQADDGENPL